MLTFKTFHAAYAPAIDETSPSLGLMGVCAPMPPTARGSQNPGGGKGGGQAKAIKAGNLLPTSMSHSILLQALTTYVHVYARLPPHKH